MKCAPERTKQVAIDARLQSRLQRDGLGADGRCLPIQNHRTHAGLHDDEVIFGDEAMTGQRRRQRCFGIACGDVFRQHIRRAIDAVIAPPPLQIGIGRHCGEARFRDTHELLLHHPVEGQPQLHTPFVLLDGFRLGSGPRHAQQITKLEASRAVHKVL